MPSASLAKAREHRPVGSTGCQRKAGRHPEIGQAPSAAALRISIPHGRAQVLPLVTHRPEDNREWRSTRVPGASALPALFSFLLYTSELEGNDLRRHSDKLPFVWVNLNLSMATSTVGE